MSFPVLYAKAQDVSEADIKKAAEATCECLEKENLTDEVSSIEAQAIFSKCLISAAPDMMMKIATQENMVATAAELGEKLMMQMIGNGCPPVTKIITAMSSDIKSGNPLLPPANNTDKEKNINKEEEVMPLKTAEGTVTLLEEKEFLTITIKTGSGRELKFLYYQYVDGSDEWIRNAATKLKNKQVSISYLEEEVYQPAIKDFTQIKVIRELTIK